MKYFFGLIFLSSLLLHAASKGIVLPAMLLKLI
jgi:hypothetical protein